MTKLGALLYSRKRQLLAAQSPRYPSSPGARLALLHRVVNLAADSKVIHQLRRCGDCQTEGTQRLADTMIPFKVLKELCALHGLAETAFTLERFDRAPDSCIFDVRMVLLGSGAPYWCRQCNDRSPRDSSGSCHPSFGSAGCVLVICQICPRLGVRTRAETLPGRNVSGCGNILLGNGMSLRHCENVPWLPLLVFVACGGARHRTRGAGGCVRSTVSQSVRD